ncbi:hypothetical protein BSKO_02871 [Bryopsis sp. KO-2023]|nr:hypothetical protein BSKO_02871 [Bryopsis sp. KO-2023]
MGWRISRASQSRLKVKSEHVSKGASMPGWGDVPNSEDWAAVDELNEREAQGLVEGATTSGQSRILSTLGALSLTDATNTEGQDLTDEGRSRQICPLKGNQDDGVGAVDALGVDANGHGFEDGDDGWQVAKSSKN